MEATKALKTQGVKHTEWRRFTTLVKMLLSDSLKISFDTKNSRKSAIIRIVTGVLLFAAITAFGVVLYRLAITLGIFSLLAFVPEVVPSALSIFIILLAVFNATNGLVKNLYFSNDNRLMITYPCRGSTIFLARLFVYYVNELVRMFIVLSPILLSYVIVSKFPWYSFVWLFIAILIVTAAVVLIGALFSIPWYYVRSFLKRNSLIALFVYAIVFAGFIWLVTWVISLIPDKIDIFTNFGPYFAKIQTLMRTFEAAEVLKDYGADNSVADDYLKDEFEEYSLITKIIATMQTPHYGIVYCVSDEHDIIERSTLAKVGNQVMTRRIRWASSSPIMARNSFI